jgi:hypothetical protein
MRYLLSKQEIAYLSGSKELTSKQRRDIRYRLNKKAANLRGTADFRGGFDDILSEGLRNLSSAGGLLLLLLLLRRHYARATTASQHYYMRDATEEKKRAP